MVKGNTILQLKFIMKKTLSTTLTLALLLAFLSGCEKNDTNPSSSNSTSEIMTELGNSDTTFGETLEDLNAYAGYFEEDTVDVTITCISGTEGCYTLDGNVLTFTSLQEDSVYSISGKLKGTILIDVGDDYKLDLELQGFSLVSDTTNPIFINSGDKISITAKSEFENYIYDTRNAVDKTDETVYSGAIYSLTDLELCGKGSLVIVSEQNNGIHTKDDLTVKNLTLLVACVDNALKGNDSVEITNGTTTLISTQGDGIKTSNCDISKKGNQRGSISISGGSHTIYAACDGIDAAYNVVIDSDTTNLQIYTDKYSNYSSEITAVSEEQYYIRSTSDTYQYSVKYYNSQEDYTWVNAEYDSTISTEKTNYYYYVFPKKSEYSNMQFYIYSADSEQSQEETYLFASDFITPSSGYDTLAFSNQGNDFTYSWTNYTTSTKTNNMDKFNGMEETSNADMKQPANGTKPENMKNSDTMHLPENMELPNDMELPENMQNPNDMELPENMQLPENMELPSDMELPENMQNPSDIETPSNAIDSMQKPDNTGKSDTNNRFGSMGKPGGMGNFGGMTEGNSDKGEYSTKGIKADNEIIINQGTITIKSYDDALHANSDITLENGETATGNITIHGGTITVYSNDDGLHADGTLLITDGTVQVLYSYEGLEGTNVILSGGNITIAALDDGINGIATSGTAIEISGGSIYINCSGDGLDSNSRSSYSGIVFSGGNTVVISDASNNSAIDTEQGYQYLSGSVIAIMPSRGMTNEVTHCSNFSDIATKTTLSLEAGNYLTINAANSNIATVEIPNSISAMVVYLGDNCASITTASSTSKTLDTNGIYWKQRN